MKITRTVLTLIALCLLLPSCYGQSTRQNRLKELNAFRTTNDFMVLFLKFIKENNLAATFIEYEDMLVKRKYLAGYDQKSLNKYFVKIITQEEDNRCINKPILKKIKSAIFKFSYAEYKQNLENTESHGSKEYTFLEYLKSGGPMWRESLEYALKDNKLTPDKKYFYLFMTTPFKSCNQ